MDMREYAYSYNICLKLSGKSLDTLLQTSHNVMAAFQHFIRHQFTQFTVVAFAIKPTFHTTGDTESWGALSHKPWQWTSMHTATTYFDAQCISTADNLYMYTYTQTRHPTQLWYISRISSGSLL